MTWWKREEPAPPPEPGVPELRRQLAEAQSDITVLFDQLERINNRLKQRDSRASKQQPDDSGDRVDRHDLSDVRGANPQIVGESPSSSSLAASTSLPSSLPTKEQVREFWRQRRA